MAKRRTKVDRSEPGESPLAFAELPEGWASTRLGEVVQPSKDKIDPKRVPDLPYLSLEHIEAHSRRIIGRAMAREATSTKAAFHSGDVLYGKLRPYLNKVCRPDFSGVCSTDILVFSQRPELDSRYLLYFLNRQEVVDATTHVMAGVNLPRVNFRTLAELEFALPPLVEQRRIADRLDALLHTAGMVRDRMAKLVTDRKEGEREIPSILNRFRQAVLTAACSGELTKDWRDKHLDVESAASLLVRCEEERKIKWKKRNPRRAYQPPSAVEEEDLPPIPRGWVWTNFDHCAWEITVGHVGPMKDRYVTSGVPFLRSQNVRPLRLDLAGMVFIPPDFHASLRKSALFGGEILVTRSGANTGDCCVYPAANGEANCADLVVTRPLAGLLPAYGAVYVSSPEGQRRIGLRETGIAQPHFNIGAMRIKAFPLPPLAEQREVVRRVEALFAVADKIEACGQATTARVEKLTQMIFSKAFSGDLVPTEAELARTEGRTFESGEQLLERISETVPPRKEVGEMAPPNPPELFTRCGISVRTFYEPERYYSSAPALEQANPMVYMHLEPELRPGGAWMPSAPHPPSEIPMGRPESIPPRFFYDILVAHKNGLAPEVLLSMSGLEIDDFYTQLKREVDAGIVRERRKDKETIIVEAVR